jgi:hypothetical protein
VARRGSDKMKGSKPEDHFVWPRCRRAERGRWDSNSEGRGGQRESEQVHRKQITILSLSLRGMRHSKTLAHVLVDC